MTSKELNENLLLNFPELKLKFEKETSWQEGINTGSFITFEDVFMPFIKENVYLNNLEKINKIFKYIENLSFIDDKYVENILYVAILENISSFKDSRNFTKYFYPNTKKIYLQNYNK